MGSKHSLGIDYGMGKTNIDKETRIRYGVINSNEVACWYEASESHYGSPTCPKCGSPALEIEVDKNGALLMTEEMDGWDRAKYETEEFYCIGCKYIFGSESAYPESPLEWILEDDVYFASQSNDDSDIFIVKAPYFTYCSFCSPCAPGAGYLLDQQDVGVGVKAYCFGHDFFDGDKAPYRVFSVETREEVFPTEKIDVSEFTSEED